MRKTVVLLGILLVGMPACDWGRPRYATVHDAAHAGDAGDVKYHLKRGEDMNARDAEANTPLHLALYGMHLGATSVLLEKGADLDIPNATGETALDLAVVQPEVMELFRKDRRLAERYAAPLGRLCNRRLERIYDAAQRLAFASSAGDEAPWPAGGAGAALTPYLGGMSIEHACPVGGVITLAPLLTGEDGFVTAPVCSLARSAVGLHYIQAVGATRSTAPAEEREDRPDPGQDEESAP